MKARATAARRDARRRGRLGEALAAWCLRLKGYRILARNLRLPAGEIDILATRGRVLAIIEVKTRADVADAAAALGAVQRARIARAAAQFIGARPRLARHRVRFDVMLVARGWPRHLRDAWRVEDGAAQRAGRAP